MTVLVMVFALSAIVGIVAVILHRADAQPAVRRRRAAEGHSDGGWSPAYFSDGGGADCSSADSGAGCDGGGGGAGV